MLKREEFTYVLAVFLVTFLKTNFHQKLISKWKNIYSKFHTALRIHNKVTFQLKQLSPHISILHTAGAQMSDQSAHMSCTTKYRHTLSGILVKLTYLMLNTKSYR